MTRPLQSRTCSAAVATSCASSRPPTRSTCARRCERRTANGCTRCAALRCAALRCAALRCAACSAQLRCALAIDSYRPIRSSARTAGAVTCGAVACRTSHDCAEIGSVETVHGGVVAQAVARIRAAVESHPRDFSQVGRSLSASRAAWLQQHCPGGTHAPLATVVGTLRSGPAVSSVLRGTRLYLTPLHGLVSRFCVPSHQQRTGSVAFAFAFPTRIRAPLRCPR